MSGLVKWLRERVRRSAPSGNLLAAHATAYGETPAIIFEDYMEAYVKDPSCKAFVDFLADQIVGMGFYTTANGDYAQAREAKQSVDEFCEDVNLDGLLQISVRETVACGNSFLEKIEPNRLETLRILPLTSIDKIKRDVYGNVQGYVQSPTHGGKTLAPERIIHFRWNPVNGEPFGTGILRSLLEKMKIGSETRMSFLEMKARIEKMLPEIFEKYAGPDELWIFEGVSDDQLGTYQNIIRNKPKAGARFVYNKPADIKTVQIDPRTQFQSYLEHIIGQINIGGQSPVSSLMISPNYLTKATAEAALDLADRKVLSAQRYVKRVVEREIFDPVVEQAGYDPKEVAIRLNWGMPMKPETIVADLIKAAELGLIRVDEFRNIMKDVGWELTEPETSQPNKQNHERKQP